MLEVDSSKLWQSRVDIRLSTVIKEHLGRVHELNKTGAMNAAGGEKVREMKRRGEVENKRVSRNPFRLSGDQCMSMTRVLFNFTAFV